MINIDLTIPKGAIFSPDRKYRYVLWRMQNPSKPVLGVVGLNPSKADAEQNDPTVVRLIARTSTIFSAFGGFILTNMHGLVSTDPNALLDNPNAVGELNDYYIKQMVELTECQLCGWGSFKPVKYRASTVYAMLPNPVCLGVNADGQPKHPLYVSYDVPMKKYGSRAGG
jgi:hypothetical protein